MTETINNNQDITIINKIDISEEEAKVEGKEQIIKGIMITTDIESHHTKRITDMCNTVTRKEAKRVTVKVKNLKG